MATLDTHPKPRGNRVEVVVRQGSVDQPGHQARIERRMGRGDRGQAQTLGVGFEEGEVEPVLVTDQDCSLGESEESPQHGIQRRLGRHASVGDAVERGAGSRDRAAGIYEGIEEPRGPDNSPDLDSRERHDAVAASGLEPSRLGVEDDEGKLLEQLTPPIRGQCGPGRIED